MTNKYKTMRKAIIDFNKSKGWKTERVYFRGDGEAAVCFTEDGGYFIITHKRCVDYRIKQREVVHLLSYDKDTDIFS